MTFSMNQFGQNFLFFSFSVFFAIFLDRFEEKAPRHQKKVANIHKFKHLCSKEPSQ